MLTRKIKRKTKMKRKMTKKMKTNPTRNMMTSRFRQRVIILNFI